MISPANDSPRIRILLVEDDDADASLATRRLSSHVVSRVPTLADAIASLGEDPPDVVLLDLNLPDSEGLETLEQVLQHASSVPVLVLTGESDRQAEAAVSMGAKDFVTKRFNDPDPLGRALRESVVRAHLSHRVEELTYQAAHTQELERLTHLGGARKQTSLSAEMLDSGPLRRRYPDLFATFVREYMSIIRASLHQQRFQEEDSVAGRAIGLSERFGRLGASPRDVIDVHRAALEQLGKAGSPKEVRALREEARYACMQALGNLASYYRLYSIRPSRTPDQGEAST